MFTSLSKKKTVSTQRRTAILKADRSLFGRVIITGQRRKIEVKDKLQHSLGPMLWALSTAEDFPRKTNKAALVLVDWASFLTCLLSKLCWECYV